MSYNSSQPYWVLTDRRKRYADKNAKKPSPPQSPSRCDIVVSMSSSVIVTEKPVKEVKPKPITVKPFGVPEQFDIPEPLMSHEQWRFLTREFDWERRRNYTKKNGWFIPTLETATILADYLKDKKVLEVASGTGYLAAHLRQMGVEDYTAVDLYINYWEANSPNYGSIVGDAFDYLNHDYDVVVMGWPPYNHAFGRDVVKAIRGQTLVLQGESRGGCTGTDDMFYLLGDHFIYDEELSDKLNAHHMQFESIHDEWAVYHHKGTKAVCK